MPQRVLRKGIAISPGMNRVRIILLFIITPLITWYAHQRFTNPFKRHVTYELTTFKNAPMLHIYNETSKTKEDLIYINLLSSSIFKKGTNKYTVISYDSDSTFLYGDEQECVPMKQVQTKTVQIQMFRNILYISGPHFEIATAFDSTSKIKEGDIDLLVAYNLNDTTSLFSLRKQLRPRLTVTNHSEKEIPNIYVWDGKKRLFLKEERYNKLSVIEAK